MIEIARHEIAEIPCIVMRDTRLGTAPVVVHYHGWRGSKGSVENPDQSLVQLASAGCLVVAPDCHEHGERQTEAWFRAGFNGWAFVCQAMDKTRQEAAGLLEAVMALPYSSPSQPQVTGTSMGGLIAQMVFAENKAYGALVSVVGRSSFFQADEWCRPMNGAGRPNTAPGATYGAPITPLNHIPTASPTGRCCSWTAVSTPTARQPRTRKRCG